MTKKISRFRITGLFSGESTGEFIQVNSSVAGGSPFKWVAKRKALAPMSWRPRALASGWRAATEANRMEISPNKEVLNKSAYDWPRETELDETRARSLQICTWFVNTGIIDQYIPGIRDHSGHGLSQWETTLHCNVVSLWLSPYPEWSVPTHNKTRQNADRVRTFGDSQYRQVSTIRRTLIGN